MRWDPGLYETFADDRGRPFGDLLTRVRADRPHCVVDLGCGPGGLTSGLRERWPGAALVGVDSSPEMIERARADFPDLTWEVADLARYVLPADVDVVVTNATLQWVPEHLTQVDRLAGEIPAGGWFAMQVPGNFTAPSHDLMRVAAREVDPSGALADAVRQRPAAHDPQVYADHLQDAGLEPDAWETTYLHRLRVDPASPGTHPVLTWVSGTGLRPWLAALDAADGVRDGADSPGPLRAAYLRTYAGLLHEAYPLRDGVATLPFRRVFAVGHRPTG